MGKTVRTPELVDTICARLSVGDPLRQICRDAGIDYSIVYDWRKQDDELDQRITRARDQGFDAIADNCLEIADDKEEDAQSRRVRVDTRLKLLAKWSPKKYGDAVTLRGDAENPLAVLSDEQLLDRIKANAAQIGVAIGAAEDSK